MTGTWRSVVLGATGYIGGRLVPELLSDGHEVVVVARSPDKLRDVPWRHQVEACRGDLTVPDSLRAILVRGDIVYYLVHSLTRPDFVKVDRAAAAPGGEPLVRQLCWRDFHHQVLAAFPDLPRDDYRPHRRRWEHDPASLEAWQLGRTGIPIVDAGMRQLRNEGWMANRARLLAASCLTRDLGLD